MSNKGYVYVLANPAMPGLVKIGRSVNGGRQRAAQLYTTGVPLPFDLCFEMLFDDCISAESAIHQRLEKHRSDTSREFFSITPKQATTAIIGYWTKANSIYFMEPFIEKNVKKACEIERATGYHFMDIADTVIANADLIINVCDAAPKVAENG